MEESSPRKSLIRGILSVASGEKTSPDPRLKEGKTPPLSWLSQDELLLFSQPHNTPIEDPDSYYCGQTYVVMNKKNNLYRFNKSKSLFLFGRYNKLRHFAVKILIAPLFAYFITFVILCNCVCMLYVEPPKWIEDYLEYIFTIIYIAEAMIKIVARGFVLHRFSYLRDPWNWLDFTVITTAIVTEILKMINPNDKFSKMAVLRAFRVLRAFKTMSTVAGLRAIVKALLRSIKALKDAVVLTVFCVAIFALIGYQLFHGTMRQKCVRLSGTLDLPPDAMFLATDFNNAIATESTFNVTTSFSNFSAIIAQSPTNVRNKSAKSSCINESCVYQPLYSTFTDECCMHNSLQANNLKWNLEDAKIIHAMLQNLQDTVNTLMRWSNLTSLATNTVATDEPFCCIVKSQFQFRVAGNSTLFQKTIQLKERVINVNNQGTKFNDLGEWKCFRMNSTESQIDFTLSNVSSLQCDIWVELQSVNTSCFDEMDIATDDAYCMEQKYKNCSNCSAHKWQQLFLFGKHHIPYWSTRQLIILFQLFSSVPLNNRNQKENQMNMPFLYYSQMDMNELREKQLLNDWFSHSNNIFKQKPKTGMYFYIEDTNRPQSEPLYCSTSDDNCPKGYGCYEAGENPDFGYTGFDDFFLAFLTSFRLVALDGWDRLYYLTLHTIGPTYAIFYMVVVFLGSYYLINLILAVVYMSYEEQQAAVDEEENEANEREKQKELQFSTNGNDSEGNKDAFENETSESDYDPEMGKMGFISMSLGQHSNLSPKTSFKWKNRRHRYGRRRTSNASSLNGVLQSVGDSDVASMYPKRKRARRMTINSPIRIEEIDKNAINERKCQLVNPKRSPISEKDLLTKRDRRLHESASGNHLVVDTSFCRHRSISSSGSDTSSTLFPLYPLIQPLRRLSESSSASETPETPTKRIIVDINSDNSPNGNDKRKSKKLFNLSTASSSLCYDGPFSIRYDQCVLPKGFPDQVQCNLIETKESPTSKKKNRRQQHKSSLRKAKKNNQKRTTYQKLYKNFIDIFAKWKFHSPHFTFVQGKIRRLVLNPFTDLIITLCIALNALFMTIEHHPMQPWFTKMLDQANLIFTIIFTVEMIIKIIGLSPYTYFRERWNVFDAVVVLLSLLEIAINSTGGLSIFRAFRLMRIAKLAKQWPTLNKLLRIIGYTLSKLWHLTLVFLLVLYVFAVVGMQLLHKFYRSAFQDDLPRWNFADFQHALMVVFRIQCGEWVENMFVCMKVANPETCIPLFILVYVIGNLVVLNLFLALLLNSFSGDILHHTQVESNSISEALRHIKRWMRKQKLRITNIIKNIMGNEPCSANPESSKTCEANRPVDAEIELNEMHSNNLKEKCDSNSLFGTSTNCEQVVKKKRRPSRSTSFNEKTHLVHKPNYFDNFDARSQLVSSYQRRNRSRRSSCRSTIYSHNLARSSLYSASGWSNHSTFSQTRRAPKHSSRTRIALARERYRGLASSTTALNSCNNLSRSEPDPDDKNTEEDKKDSLKPCLPCWPKSFLERGLFLKIREFMHKVVDHPYFGNFVIFCILLSSISLAMEDIYLHQRPALERAVKYIDLFCCIFFIIEMVMKWIGYGWKKYFTNAWCLLDCFIVLISIINLAMSGNNQANLSSIRALRTFRAFRPLRALSRFKGMKVVVDSLVRAIPSIFNVFLVCCILWLVFSIFGVNVFGGRFGRCITLPTGDILPARVDNETVLFGGKRVPTKYTLAEQCSRNNTLLLKYLNKEVTLQEIAQTQALPAVRNRQECELCATLLNTTNIKWQIPKVNFDNVPHGYLALLQVATFNGWVEIMDSAIDITGIEEQPFYEASFYNYSYFCIFIVFGAFFSLNLFIGVIIDNFNQQKIKQKKGEDGVFLTEDQKKYYNAMKKMASKTPKKPIPRPENPFANKIYNVVTNRKFEIGVMIFILLNLVVMAVEHHDMSREMNEVLHYFNLGFICIFLLEAILKLIGLRFYYFTIAWNVFDMLVVIISLTVNCFSLATGLNNVMSEYFVQPTLFRIIRLFRVTRILRLIKEAKGIRTLLFALMMSIPALFNIGSLLFLLISIYAIVGMSQFPYVQKISGVDDILNFETFPNAFLVLFQVSTSEGWNKFLDPILLDTAPYCDPHPDDGSPSNCGDGTFGSLYFVTYVVTTYLIMVNMYIAVILENFEVATRENAEPLTADDFEHFFEVWQRFDDRLSQYVYYDELQQLLNDLDFPLQVPLPNTEFIADSRMRITINGRVHCMEVIIALIRKVLGDSPELEGLKETMMKSFSDKCKIKEDDETETMDAKEFTEQFYAAVVIQRAYRDYRLQKLFELNASNGTGSDASGDYCSDLSVNFWEEETIQQNHTGTPEDKG